MFEIEDYIVYGNNGVCKVMEIGCLDLDYANKEKTFYTLQPVYGNGILYTPIDNDKVVMRKVISKEEAKNLIEDIPNIEIFTSDNEKEAERNFKESMTKCDCREWIKIIKTLNVKKQERISQGKKISSTDEKYLNAAEDNLLGELAIPLNMPKDEVLEYIMDKLEQ